MARPTTDSLAAPLAGGVDTVHSRVLLPPNRYSVLQNWRALVPGFIKRKGQIRHHTVADSSLETMQMYQFSKGKASERHLFRQLVDGSVQEATDAPPSTTTGAFGSDVLAAVSDALPASFSTINDICLFTDGKRAPQINIGSGYPVKAAISHPHASFPVIPESGLDYSVEASDGISTTLVVIPTTSGIFIMSPVPVASLTFTITQANAIASLLDVSYWKGSWRGVTGLSDGTLSGGITLAQSGTVTWTAPTDELPHYQFGRSGFWYLVQAGVPFSQVKLLLHLDNNLTDSSPSGHTVTASGNASSSATQSKFGGYSLALDGTGDYISTPDHADFALLGAFTIDCWFRLTNQSEDHTFVDAASNFRLRVAWRVTGTRVGLSISSNGSSWDVANNTAGSKTSWVNGQWYHLALTWDGSNYRVFIDGVLDQTVASASAIYGATNQLRVGAAFDGSLDMNGYIDEVRVINGSAVWTAGFTPATVRYPNTGFGITHSEIKLSAIACSAGFQPIVNLWDGVLVPAIEAMVYDTTQLKMAVFGSSSIDLSKMGTDDYCYFSTIDPISGIYIDPGATPNVTKATVTGSSNISFKDGGSGDDYIVSTDANFVAAGFEAGQTIVVSGTTSNNVTTKLLSVSANTIYVATGVLTAENNTSATITFGPNTTAINAVQYWNGSSWASVSDLSDDTVGITQPGFVVFDRTSASPQPLQFNDSQYYAYWYRFTVSVQLSSNVNISILTLPYFDINDLGNGVCNTVWKERACYSFGNQYVYISRKDSPMAINGADAAVLEAGDGRGNQVLCMRKFYNDLLVWQEEKGQDGGCLTLFEGYSPQTFGKLMLSDRVGILNAKCAAVVDGIITATKTEEKLKTVAFWLSAVGVLRTDGRAIDIVSDDIQNYFDPTKAECIRHGYESKMWLVHDKAYNVIRVGLVSGASATVPNIFPVLNLTDGTWSFDVLGQALSCIANVEAASGNTPILQVGGGSSDGYVYQCNQTQDDVSTVVDSKIGIDINGRGVRIAVREAVLRVASQSSGNVTQTAKINGGTATIDTKTLAMTAETAGDIYRRHRMPVHYSGHHVYLELRNNESGVSAELLDFGVAVEQIAGNM